MEHKRRSTKTLKSQKSSKNESRGSQEDWSIEADDTEITIGFEKAGFGVEFSIGESIELTLGIGVSSVTLDLNEPNNSSISFAFDLYEISGERDGCTVTLTYTIAGVIAKTETRTIPECDQEEEPEEEPRDPPNEGEDLEAMPQPPYPSGNPMDLIIRFHQGFRSGFEQGVPGCVYANLQVLEWSDFRYSTNYGRYKAPRKVRCISHYFAEVAYGQFQDYEKTLYFVQESFLTPSYDFRIHLPIRQSWPPHQLGFLTGELSPGGQPIYRYEYINSPAMSFSRAGYLGRRWEFDRVAALHAKADRHGTDYYSIFFREIILEDGIISKTPPIPPPRKKKGNVMDEKCCKMIAQIWEVLRAEDVLKDGYPIPKKLIAPGGKGYDKPKDYPAILKRLIQILDKGLISDFTAILEDSDLSTPGDQPQTKTFPDATASMQEVVQFLMKNKVDDATVQDILIRQTILQAEIMEALMETRSIVKTLLIGLGIPYKDAVGKFNMPVDVDVDEDKAAEKNLPQFLQESQKNYEAVDPDLSSDTLWFYVTMMYLKSKR